MLTDATLEALRPSLFAGHYNLLLGSGISLDSTDKKGVLLKSAWDLTADLCTLKGVKATTPLSRVSLLLEKEEVEKYITDPYRGCKPGETVRRLTKLCINPISRPREQGFSSQCHTSVRNRA